VRIVCISDTHSFNEHIGVLAGDDPAAIGFVPNGDVLIHAGDLTDTGTPNEIFDAFAWLSKMPHERVIVTPGNHDFAFEKLPELRRLVHGKFPRVQMLIDEETIIGNVRAWASPWTPWFHDWAFNFLPGPAGERQAEDKWDQIPDDTAFLVTHGPPYGILDGTLHRRLVGDVVLKHRISQLKNLKMHVFGHIHEGHGTMVEGAVTYVNAAICDHLYDPVQRPIVIEWNGEHVEVVQE
jgi:predicted phosphodiesterase